MTALREEMIHIAVAPLAAVLIVATAAFCFIILARAVVHARRALIYLRDRAESIAREASEEKVTHARELQQAAELAGQLEREAVAWKKETAAVRDQLQGKAIALEVSTRTEQRLERALELAEGRYTHLVGQMLEMKRDGFVIPPVLQEERREESAAADEGEARISAAIEERGTSAQLRRQLAAYADTRKREGAKSEEIAREILQGADTDHLA